jgi:hypothetical protein
MKKIVIAAAMSLCLVSLATVVAADTLVLRDGTRVQGTVVGFASRTITFRHADGVTRRYQTSQVAAVEFLSAERTNPHAANGRNLEAPAGTELVVRTVETIDSRNVGADQAFSAIVEQEITNESGYVIIPGRSSAQLVIRQVSADRATGRPEMRLDIQSISVDGRRYLISTRDLAVGDDQGVGSNRRTAETVGGGAVLGTIIGAIAGGGKGAAIGAVAGGVGGVGVQIMTSGRDVRVPADTILRFRLDRAVVFHPER